MLYAQGALYRQVVIKVHLKCLLADTPKLLFFSELGSSCGCQER
jgi:hypothetical protein